MLERAVHDLKNPLAVVRASLEWLELELADREDAVDAVRDARAASERLLDIVDQIDELARLEEGMAVNAERLDLAALLEDVAASATVRLASRAIVVTAHAPAGLSATGDARLLVRSLKALVDATARGAPSGSCIDLTASSWAAAGELTIDIGLQGAVDVGELQPALGALQSAGLGVYLALRVIEACGGSLGAVPTTEAARLVVRLPR